MRGCCFDESSDGRMLQRGRRSESTEIGRALQRPEAEVIASKGPSIRVDGDAARRTDPLVLVDASKGPSIRVDGDMFKTQPWTLEGVLASKGPSIRVDGDGKCPVMGALDLDASKGPSIRVDGDALRGRLFQ